MQQTADAEIQPWYRQAWPWFLISLPASAVIGGIITIIIAVQSPNAMVADDYYKQGLAINQEKQRLRNAEQMNLKGLLRVNSAGELSLELGGDVPVSPQQLKLEISHFTRSELDQKLVLEQQSQGRYVATLKNSLRDGTWYLRMQPEGGGWEIRSRITINGGAFQALLTSAD